jgi:CHASE2 domain-containing sensor protein
MLGSAQVAALQLPDNVSRQPRGSARSNIVGLEAPFLRIRNIKEGARRKQRMRKRVKWLFLAALAEFITDAVRRLIPTRENLQALSGGLKHSWGSFTHLHLWQTRTTQWLIGLLHSSTGAVRRMLPTRGDFRALSGCFKHPAGSFSCIRLWWKDGLLKERRHFLFNMLLGLIITTVLYFLHHTAVLEETESAAVDWMMGIYKGIEPGERTLPLGAIDIDDETYEEWEAPLYIPRDKLAQLMEFVLQSEPRMLLVDVDLASRGHNKEFDQEVLDWLNGYHDRCWDKPLLDPSCPPIAFAASLRQSDSGLWEQRDSHLNSLVEASKHIFWASPLFDKDPDGVIRHWRIWEPVCRNGKPAALPSFQLLAANLLTNEKDIIETNDSYLRSLISKEHRLKTCKITSDNDSNKNCKFVLWSKGPKKIRKLDLSLDRVARRSVARRIHYIVPWQADNDGIGGSPTAIPTVTTLENQQRFLLTWLTARAFKNSITHMDGDDRKLSNGMKDRVKDRVVIIGGSFREGRDLHETPMGEMPGALILMNALHSLLQYGEYAEPMSFFYIPIEVALIVMMSILFTMLNPFWAKLASAGIIVVALLPASVYLFGRGVWLDFALPLLAVSILEITAGIMEAPSIQSNTATSESSPGEREANT